MEIRNVSDTALWVAVYRARESKRADALFRDPYAEKLAGHRGEQIANAMTSARYTDWTVVVRTVIIDRLIKNLLNDGSVDTVINLGAGLDTRPYRMDLPCHLRWIEVDYPHMVEIKTKSLEQEQPRCQLERVQLDLNDVEKRRQFFARSDFASCKVLVLTEGVLPYLTEEQVASLANDINAQPAFRYWIAEYISPAVRNRINTKKRMREMRNALFQFLPDDWFSFFAQLGWQAHEICWMGDEGKKLGRPFPLPLYAKILMSFMGAKRRRQLERMSAFVLLKRT